MAFDIQLKTEWADKTAIVSWQEPHTLYHAGSTIKGPLVYISSACLIGGVGLPILTGQWWLLLLLPVGFAFIFVGMKQQPLEKTVTISPSQVTFNGEMYQNDRVSRFSIGRRKDWATSDEADKKGLLQNQIQMWLEDDQLIEISRNDFSGQLNHQIRNTLDKALQKVRSTSVQTERENSHGEQGKFGVPDY